MKSNIILATVLLFTANSLCAQKEFFRSKQTFSPSQLNNFYSSVAVEGNLLLFIANDYKLYAYDKICGEQKWVASIGFKTTTPSFTSNGIVYAPYYSKEVESTATFDAVTGNFIKQLPFGPLLTKPVVKDGVLYGTAIYEFGCLLAYDTKADSMLWWKFIAHGMSTQPYFFPNYIKANAEGNNWFTINYKGQLTDTTCKEKADAFVEGIPCMKIFGALTHDALEIDEAFSAKIFDEDERIVSTQETYLTAKQTFIMWDDWLVVVGNKRKIINRIDLAELLVDSIQEYGVGLTKLLAANDETVTLIYCNQLVVYNFKNGKIEKQVDLTSFNPYQLQVEQDKLWLISKNDGLLYGLLY